MDGSESVVRYEEGLEDGFFASLKHFEPLSIINAFEELCAQEYEKVLQGKMGEEWQPSLGRLLKDMELNAMKKECEVWQLLKQLSEERLKRRRDKTRSDRNNSSKMAFSDNIMPRLDDKMTILDALDQDEVLKEVDIIVQWLENQYSGIFHSSPSRRTSSLETPSHHHQSFDNMSSRGTQPYSGSHHMNSSIIASEAPALASRLDLNGKPFKSATKAGDSSVTSSLSSKDELSSNVALNAFSSADQQLNQQIWRLFRGGQLGMARNMLLKGGQSARFSSFAPFASGLQGAFTDPFLVTHAHGLFQSEGNSSSFPSSSLSNMMNLDSTPSSGLTPSPAGIIHRSLMKQTLASISSLTSSQSSHSEKQKGQFSADPSSSSSKDQVSRTVLDAYERALYSCLSGFIGGVLPVCETWEDFLWVFLKIWLHQRLERLLSSPNSLNSTEWSYQPSTQGELIWAIPAASPIASLPSSSSNDLHNRFAEQLSQSIGQVATRSSAGGAFFSKSSNLDLPPLGNGKDSEAKSSEDPESITSTHFNGRTILPTSKSLESVLSQVLGSSSFTTSSSSLSNRETSSNAQYVSYTSPTDSETLMDRLREYLASLETGRLPAFPVPKENNTNVSSGTDSSANVLQKVAIEAKEAFRTIESYIILQSWPSLFSYLKHLCSSVITSESDKTGMRAGTEAQHFGNPSHVLRFAAHLVLALESIYPNLYEDEQKGGEKKKGGKVPEKKFASFSAKPTSSTAQASSVLADDAAFIISKYVEHLMDKEGCRHLVAQYCARMPPSRHQLGYDLYVTMIRRIKTTRERQRAIEEANEANLDSALITSLLVEDIISDPSSDVSSNQMVTDNPESSSIGAGIGLSTTPSRVGAPFKAAGHASHGKPMSFKLTSRTTSEMGAETPNKFSAQNRPFESPGVLTSLTPAPTKASARHETWLSLLVQSEPTEYLSRLITLAASCHSSSVASSLTPTFISSKNQPRTIIEGGVAMPSPMDIERIHSLEWLVLSDSDEKQKLLCLKHANALARSFILASNFTSARLLFNTVNELLSGLFTKHQMDQTAQNDEGEDEVISEEDHMSESGQEEGQEEDENLKSAFIASPKALLKEYMSLSGFLESLEAFSRWYHEGSGQSKSDKWVSRAITASLSRSSKSGAEFELFDDFAYDQDGDDLNAATSREKKTNSFSSKLSGPTSVASAFSSPLFHSTAAEAIEKLGQVVYYPSGWLSDASPILSSQSAHNSVASLLKRGLLHQADASKMPRRRSSQMSLLMHLCVPFSLILLQHTLLATHRLSDAVLLCNDLASDTQKLFLHCSSTAVQAFLIQVQLAALFHLNPSSSSSSIDNGAHASSMLSSNANVPFPF